MSHYETDKWPFKQAKNYKNTNTRAVRVVVVHDMEAPERINTAESCANYFATTDRPASAHLCIDADSIVQCVYDGDVAYAAPGANHDGIQIEFAGYARQTRQEWLDEYSKKMLERGAKAIAQYCLKYHLNPKHLTRAELSSGKTGVTAHVDVSNVYKKSSHTDPGVNFPWDYFMPRIQYFYDTLQGKPAPTPKPVPAKGATYTVKSGDTLYSVGRMYRVTVDQLKKANNLQSDTLKVGQVLKVPAAAPAAPPKPAPAPAKPKPTPARPAVDVRALQRAVRTGADGVWGDDTDQRLAAVRQKRLSTKALRQQLQRIVGTNDDGAWGPKSEAAYKETVKDIQDALRVEADGIWGAKTDSTFAAARHKYHRT